MSPRSVQQLSECVDNDYDDDDDDDDDVVSQVSSAALRVHG